MTLTLSQKKRLAAEDQATIDTYFTQACRSGNMEDIIYLCFSPDLKYRANISSQHYEGFRLACRNNHFETVKFLTQSHRHAKPLNVNGDKNLGKDYAQTHENVEILEYLMKDPQLVLEKNNISYSYMSAKNLFFSYISKADFNDRTLTAASWVFNLDEMQQALKNKTERAEFVHQMLTHIYNRNWSREPVALEKVMTYLLSESILNINLQLIDKHYQNIIIPGHPYITKEEKESVFGTMKNICHIFHEKEKLSTLIDDVIQSKEPSAGVDANTRLETNLKAKHNKI